jgi:hypothetical protein
MSDSFSRPTTCDFAAKIVDEPHHDLVRIHELLDQARRGDDAPWGLSTAMALIERSAFAEDGPSISNTQKVQLMEAANAAIIGAARWLPPTVSDELLAAGLRGVLHQVAYWYLGRDGVSRFPQDLLSVSAAHARILRNQLHNLSLAREINARSQHEGNAIEALAAFRTCSPVLAQGPVGSRLN